MKSRIKRKRLSDEMTLQITSMADIFTIILVFLLKSYSSSSIDISKANDIRLPEGQSPSASVEAVKVEVSPTVVQVDGKPVVAPQTIQNALDLVRKRQQFISRANPEVKEDSKILIIADEKITYGTLKTILSSASATGFTDYKFVVARRD